MLPVQGKYCSRIAQQVTRTAMDHTQLVIIRANAILARLATKKCSRSRHSWRQFICFKPSLFFSQKNVVVSASCLQDSHARVLSCHERQLCVVSLLCVGLDVLLRTHVTMVSLLQNSGRCGVRTYEDNRGTKCQLHGRGDPSSRLWRKRVKLQVKQQQSTQTLASKNWTQTGLDNDPEYESDTHTRCRCKRDGTRTEEVEDRTELEGRTVTSLLLRGAAWRNHSQGTMNSL